MEHLSPGCIPAFFPEKRRSTADKQRLLPGGVNSLAIRRQVSSAHGNEVIKVSPIPYTHSFSEFGGRRQRPPLHQPIQRGLRDRQVLGRFFRPQKTWFHNQFPSNGDKEGSCSGRKLFCFYAGIRLRMLSIYLFFYIYYHRVNTICQPITMVVGRRSPRIPR